jgi:hypothetical protein
MSVQIDPPPRSSRPYGTAVTSYYQLDTGPFEPNPNRWAFDGVTFVPYGCDTLPQELGVDPCDDADSDEAGDAPNPEAVVTFPPFRFKARVRCTDLSMTPEELSKYLDVQWESEVSPIIAEQVMAGVWNSAAPTLISEAVDVSQANMAQPMEAVGAVEDGLADAWRGSVGMIHMPPSVLFQVRSVLTFQDGRYYTPSGHVVVADAGYQAGSPASGVVTTNTAWIYGSSPVHFLYQTPNWSGFDWENIDFTRNEITMRVDGIAIAVFEPCSVVASLVNYAEIM